MDLLDELQQILILRLDVHPASGGALAADQLVVQPVRVLLDLLNLGAGRQAGELCGLEVLGLADDDAALVAAAHDLPDLLHLELGAIDGHGLATAERSLLLTRGLLVGLLLRLARFGARLPLLCEACLILLCLEGRSPCRHPRLPLLVHFLLGHGLRLLLGADSRRFLGLLALHRRPRGLLLRLLSRRLLRLVLRLHLRLSLQLPLGLELLPQLRVSLGPGLDPLLRRPPLRLQRRLPIIWGWRLCGAQPCLAQLRRPQLPLDQSDRVGGIAPSVSAGVREGRAKRDAGHEEPGAH
mmetsp:Transcript_7990/g.18146  ORF Transcript_7990/g.18146 Transcript_7990/m.18146 type:complete len:296 (-) Transcript_7990:28-915(-)